MALLSRRRQRGAATLFVVALLSFAMVLVVAHAHRNVLVEEHRSGNDYRAAAAFEAAEAGLEWALGRVNDATTLDDSCRPSTDASARSMRDRLLLVATPSGAITPRTWNDAGVAAPLQAACLRSASGWTCSCPTSGAPLLPAPSDAAIAPGFVVELAPASRNGVVRVVATGCTRLDARGGCAATAAGHEAAMRLEAAWALLPALRAAPAAALTVRGSADAGAAPLGVHNPGHSSDGLALHAGGRIVASALRIIGADGSPLGGAIASGDAELAALTEAHFFARYFGMDLAAWSHQPAARRVTCPSDCTTALGEAIDAGHRLLFIDGDLALTGPAAFGSAVDPVAIAVRGAARFSGEVSIHGVVHGASLQWNDSAAPGARIQGAALIAGNYSGNAAADFVRDDAVLTRLRTGSGSLVRVNGSWKDF